MAGTRPCSEEREQTAAWPDHFSCTPPFTGCWLLAELSFGHEVNARMHPALSHLLSVIRMIMILTIIIGSSSGGGNRSSSSGSSGSSCCKLVVLL